MPTMLSAALALAEKGFAVFPCDPEDKRPLTKHGHLEATRAPSILHDWWEEWPDAIIGGKVPSHLLVLDTDPRNGGSVEQLNALLPEGKTMPDTLKVISGRGDGGVHLYYRRPNPERWPRLSGSGLGNGIDLKINGYCIMPPSLHPATGKPYRWVPAPIVSLPAELIAKMIPPPPKPYSGLPMTDGTALAITVRNAADGERNSMLHWAACRAAEEHATDAVYDALIAAAVATGLSEREAQRTIESAQRSV